MPGFLKIANKRLFKRNHGIVTDVASAVSGDETNSSEDESMILDRRRGKSYYDVHRKSIFSENSE